MEAYDWNNDIKISSMTLRCTKLVINFTKMAKKDNTIVFGVAFQHLTL